MATTNKGDENGPPKFPDARNIRICINHFHHSVTQRDNNGNYGLKTGVSPNLCLNRFGIQKDNYKEERSLPRIVDCTEDMQHVCDYENNRNSTNSRIVDWTEDTQHVWDYENNNNAINSTAKVSIVPTQEIVEWTNGDIPYLK